MTEHSMNEPVSPLTREFLAWMSSRPRTYAEAMEAWRTTCPRHSVWEDALINGLIQFEDAMNESKVTLTPRGRSILDGKS
jgi:hypothetical protein